MDFRCYSSQEILERISRHCPEAMVAYIHCINRPSNFGPIRFTRKQIEEEMSESWTAFRNNLKKLARENLLTWSTDKRKNLVVILPEEQEEETDPPKRVLLKTDFMKIVEIERGE